MKKIKYLLFTILFIPFFVFAKEDVINRIDVNITLDSNGNAHIVEKWDVVANMGTEFYKAEYNLGKMEISNFTVEEDDRKFTFINNWNLDASINEKAYKNGYNYSSDGLELCWGKGTLGEHTFTISYDVSNFVFNTSDAQVVYWQIINNMSQMPKKFSAVISGPQLFSDKIDVWEYGNQGYAYVLNGKIMMSNDDYSFKNDDYAVLLVKFPLNSFTTISSNMYDNFKTFDDVYNKSQENTFEYDYEEDYDFLDIIIGFISSIIPFLFIIGIVVAIKKSSKYRFGKTGKTIKMKEINCYRDIPCDKNIFEAYFLAQAYSLNKKNTDFLGSILLKWLFEKRVEIQKNQINKLFGSKEEQCIVFKNDSAFDTDEESEIFNMLKEASINDVLESNELKKWSSKNYNKLFDWFEKAEKHGCNLYLDKSLVSRKNGCYLISDELKMEAIKLAGLKKFLLEFSRIKEREAIEVMLWKDYLIYAQIFGIADTVAKQFKDLYPEVVSQQGYEYDYSDIILINNISRMTVVSASTARSAAQHYTSGGGGFSIGGGGGGSFGGGGGGGR